MISVYKRIGRELFKNDFTKFEEHFYKNYDDF